MFQIVLPIAVLAMLLLFVDQLRRLIAHAILNRTIRKTMETDPASAPLLIAKLDTQKSWPNALVGWILVVGGIALAVTAAFEHASDRREIFETTAVALIIGLAVFAYAWWVQRAISTEK